MTPAHAWQRILLLVTLPLPICALVPILNAVLPLPLDRTANIHDAWVTGGPCDKSAEVIPERLIRNGTELTLYVVNEPYATRQYCRAPGVSCWDFDHGPCHPTQSLFQEPFFMPVFFGPVHHTDRLITQFDIAGIFRKTACGKDTKHCTKHMIRAVETPAEACVSIFFANPGQSVWRNAGPNVVLVGANCWSTNGAEAKAGVVRADNNEWYAYNHIKCKWSCFKIA